MGSSPGDRRQITVAFCDLVDSTVLAETLDPEELRDVVASYQSACADVIARWDGHIAQFLGDGILVYFGYPIAHEDDPVRAIRASLEIAETVASMQPEGLAARGFALAVRVGVHTGLVVTSEIGVGERKEVLALGSTPNVGARLQSLAPANAVVVSQETMRLTEGFFEFEIVPRQVRAGSQLITGYRVLESNPTQTRFGLAVAQGLTPFQGRGRERALLEDAWSRVQSGVSARVCIRGEPGIGKSRLVHQFRETLAADRHALWLSGRCTSFTQDSAFSALAGPLQQLIAAFSDFAPSEVSAAAPSLAGDTSATTARVQRLAPILGLPLPPELRTTPEVARQDAFECTIESLREQASRRPVVLCLEDLHWSDPSTLELLDRVLPRLSAAPMLVLATARSEFLHDWPEAAAFQELALGSLAAGEMQAIVAHIAKHTALPAATIDAIVARTDGVPLFVEELTKVMLEQATQRRPSDRPESAPSIPTTLQDSLMARLDRLSEGKRVAQLGAAVGREFSLDILSALALLPDSVLVEGIEQLARADLLSRARPGGARSYMFKHALIQDAAYASLLRSDRRRYHGRIADVLASRFRDQAERQPELIAHHLAEAGRAPEAIEPWIAASQRSLARGATTEAMRYLERARTAASGILDERKRWERELHIEMVVAQAARAVSGYASPEVENAYSSALELSQRLAEASGAEVSTQMLLARLQCGQDFHAKTQARDSNQANQLFWIMWGFGAYHQSRAELHRALEIGQQLIALAGDHPALALEGHFGSGSTAYFLGRMPEAEHHLRSGWKCFETMDRRAETSPTGHHAEVLCAGYLSLAQWSLGFLREAEAQAERAIAVARAADHPYSIAYAMTISTWLAYQRRDLERAGENAAATLEYAKRYQFGFPVAWSTPVALWAAAIGGGASTAAQLKATIEDYRRSGQLLALTYFSAMLAEVLIAAGQPAEAQTVLVRALANADSTDERFWQPELYRLQAEAQLRAAPANPAAASHSFESGIRLARRLGARSLELRCTLGLLAHELKLGSVRVEVVSALRAQVEDLAPKQSSVDLEEAKRLLERAKFETSSERDPLGVHKRIQD